MSAISADRELSGKSVVVTAAGNGIGRSTAIMFANAGSRVTCIDEDAVGLGTTVDEIRQSGGTATQFVVDCTDEAAVTSAFAQIAEVDVLVNGVGSSARQRAREFWESESEVWKWVIDVSLMTAMLCSRQVVGAMRARRQGKIINISSDAALRPQQKLVDYASAKAGVIGFTRALSAELAPFGVNVNAVCPGLINTQALAQIPEPLLASARQEIPLGIIGEPEDIANVVLFLASEKSRYMTGQTVAVNGGRHLL